MTITMDDRRRAFESKWAHDAELRFQVEARRNRALGEWAAAKKGLTGEAVEDLVAGVIAADFQEPGDEDVFRKLRSELDASVSDTVIRDKMREYLHAAMDRAAKATQ
ncbi:MAG TPA: DUF1476 domain-containing protein [Rhizomicrobium sp.]|jgi:hypothetical protein|nr:DUF1476 domain-containing protein [Rhizomicrobium sp.]